MSTKWFSLYQCHSVSVDRAMDYQPSDSVYMFRFIVFTESHKFWPSLGYLEVISMNQTSTSIECMMMLSVDNGFQVSKHHRVYLQNLSANNWADFVILMEIYVLTDFDKLWFGLIYICNELYYIQKSMKWI